MKFFLIILFALILGAVFIISNNNLALSEGDNLGIFCKKYINWVDAILINMKDTTGYAISLKWNPENV